MMPMPDGTATWVQQPPQGILIPSGTKANIQNRQVLQGGNLVDPYPASANDLRRNRAVEVELIKIKDGPYRNIQGWMPSDFLQHTTVMP
jgi:hypothetical protein